MDSAIGKIRCGETALETAQAATLILPRRPPVGGAPTLQEPSAGPRTKKAAGAQSAEAGGKGTGQPKTHTVQDCK
ncbi:hypothetical protein QFZ22_000046 [Streptomyces canus]|uniref:Transposase n=1 Tax=Streptomyces canus TaxID=58343 RepID=A0AAW8F488_9ACTN|nr:hypothetical protein [Streptomyces canus]